MEKFLEKVEAAVSKAAKETEKMARIAKRKAEILALQHKMDTIFTKIGREIYQAAIKGSGIPRNPKVKELIKNVKELEEEKKVKEQEIIRIRKETS
ncbi:MAG: hypothetical protein AB1393_12295 [Candidatus Edwardsbacteria bacterium]